MKRMSQNATAAAAATGMTENMNTVGLGYGIAIAVGILVLVSTIMLASYVCVRVHGRGGAARVRGLGGLGGVETGADPRGNIMVTSYGDGGSDGRGAGDRREEDTATISTGYGEWTIGGLDEATLESCPKFSYAEKKLFHGYQHADDSSCSICLADYRDGELIRMLPDCRHSFHAACVDAWLRLHASCPMCRTSPLPTPVSTPLSELIPLARHPIQSHYRL